jgi:hypothetical protein
LCPGECDFDGGAPLPLGAPGTPLPPPAPNGQ